jgi:heme a synthase
MIMKTSGDVHGDTHLRAIRLWLYAVAAMVLAMVLIGGATRLTESGLSITEWRPVMGVVPPLSEAQWQAEFAKYQAIPQYRALNSGMSLDAFKTIYWWEWTHRMIGRLIGMVFLLPFLWLLWRGWVGPALRGKLWFIFGLGALQGAVGWWMVASGLADRVQVSQYRLATHLVLASIIYVAMLWTAVPLGGALSAPNSLPQREGEGRAARRIRTSAIVLVILVLAQIYLGALVAGLRAGLVYNTWPLIDGALVPSAARLFFDTPLWRNFFENLLTAQFDHRMVAYTLWVCAGLHALDAVRNAPRGVLVGALALFVAISVQATLGIVVLLQQAPLMLALLHQAMAMVTLTFAAIHAARLASARTEQASFGSALATPAPRQS